MYFKSIEQFEDASLDYPKHGGDIAWASKKFGGDINDWRDLSTGISPRSWPLPTLPNSVASRLPCDYSELLRSCKHYFGTEHWISIANGSSRIITELPKILPCLSVAVPSIGFKNHEEAWRKQGVNIHQYESKKALYKLASTGAVSGAVIINPNNPTGELFTKEECLTIEYNLRLNTGKDYGLIVDEAFIDATDEHSLARSEIGENTIILRSFGKFFGLAGLRLGFALTHQQSPLKNAFHFDSWDVNHPAIWWGTRALNDSAWQISQRKYLHTISLDNYNTLSCAFPTCEINKTAFFNTISGPKNIILKAFTYLAKNNILTRYINVDQNLSMIRFGLFTDKTITNTILNINT